MTSGSEASTRGRRPQLLTPRARLLLPIFLVVLVTLAVRQLWCALPERVALSGQSMGTTWSVVLGAAGRDRSATSRARAAIEAELAAVNARMSTWDPDSELSRFNRHASGDAFPMSSDTIAVLELSQQVSEQSQGAFDVTVAPLVAAWGFGAGARVPGAQPDAAELAGLRERVGYHLLEIDAAAGTARKRRADLECDLSAIAKGFAVDQVARALTEQGWSDFLVEVGGEVRAHGVRPGGGPWRVGIERPDPSGRVVQGVVALADAAMATSGDYRSFYEAQGERRSHIVDPRSGRPVSHPLASVSVISSDAVLADAWATALSVLGPAEGLRVAEERRLSAYFITRVAEDRFEMTATSRFPELEAQRDARVSPD